MWTDGAFICIREDETGDLVAQVIRQAGGTWGAFDAATMNPDGTGYRLVKNGFPDVDAAKAFVDAALAGHSWN